MDLETVAQRRRRKILYARSLRKHMTEAEAILWSALRARRCNGYKFRRQVPIDWFIVDFLCSQAQLIIEIDGLIHDSQKGYDHDREREIRKRGYRILRFTNEDICDRLPMVLQTIRQALSPLPGGRTGLWERGRG
jgi:very-short-patch-repair endonuclease